MVPAGGTLVMVDRLDLQLERRLLADRRPGPGGELRRQHLFPAPGLQGGDFRIGGGGAHQRQRGQVGAGASALAGAAGEKDHRVVDRIADHRRRQPAEDADRLLGRLRPIRVDSQPGLAPDVGVGQLAGLEQRQRHLHAAVVGLLLGEPGGAGRLAHVAAGYPVGEQGIALHLAVVVHDEARIVGGDRRPVAPAAELEQPVVAQPVLDIAAAPAGVEGVDFGLLRRRQTARQFPVVGPLREWMGVRDGDGARGGEAAGVAAAQRVARIDDGLRIDHAGRWRGRLRTGRQTGAGQRRRHDEQRGGNRPAPRGRTTADGAGFIYWIDLRHLCIPAAHGYGHDPTRRC